MLPFKVVVSTTKIVLKLHLKTTLYLTLLTVFILLSIEGKAQSVTDSLGASVGDSVLIQADTALSDTLDSQKTEKKSIVDEPVYYTSKDSMQIKVKEQKVFLYGDGKVNYQKFELKANYIESDLGRKEISGKGVIDTTGKYSGKPVFKMDNEEFESDSVNYNLDSRKGLIYNVVSEQGEGYLHSDLTKRDEQGHIHVKGGKYTTCDAEHPHFYLELTRAIVIPEDKIISGPAYLVIEDVPIPILGLPFSFFPNSKNRSAGVIIPRYGEERVRGFFLTDGGWYQPLGQYADMQITGDIYSKGSWAVKWGGGYKVRYRFRGSTSVDYSENRNNDVLDYPVRKDFKWIWSHQKDPKANPTQSFSANVNFQSGGYDRSNPKIGRNVISQQKSSSISFSKNWPGTPFNLALSANARQNTADSTVSIDLPTGSFNASTIYPFRKKDGGGKYKWYENIGFSYNSQFASKIQNVKDSTLGDLETWRNMNAGFKHSIPFVINLKTDKIKMLTISPSLTYEGRLNNRYITKRIEPGTTDIVVDTTHKLAYAHAINPSISVSLSPKVYGMFQNTRPDPNVIAVRHMIQPRASFSFTPDMREVNPNYYDTLEYVQDDQIKIHRYSYFDSPYCLYGAPGSPGKNGTLSLSLGNNLEMKMKPKNDTTGEAEPVKVPIIRNLSVSTSYRPFEDEFNWNDVSINGSTQLFKNKLNINVSSRYSFYDLDSLETARINEFYFDNGKGLLRFTNLTLSTQLSLQSKQSDKKEAEAGAEADLQEDLHKNPYDPNYEFIPGYSQFGSYVDFSVPWSLSFRYNWSLNRPTSAARQTRTHTLGINGNLSLTKTLKIGFGTNYDFENKEMVSTNIRIDKDLHCWVMEFSTVPFGDYRNYSFTIRAKSGLLRDLKYDKKQSWYDNY